MGKYEKLIEQILRGAADSNISFPDVCWLLERLGFVVRIRGSHHIFRKEGVEEKINLQRDGAKAKAYQIKQVREVIIRYKLVGESDV